MSDLVEDLGAVGATATASVYGVWAGQVLDGKPDPLRARRRLLSLDATVLQRVIFEGRIRGLMLGFVLGLHELVTPSGKLKLAKSDEQEIARAALIVQEGGGRALIVKPFGEAIKAFKSRVPVTRESWDRMVDKERRRAFTVANLARNDFVQVAQEVMTRAMEESWEKEDFTDALEQRFVEAGLSPLNPSHAETVFRTNINTAYADGRMGCFTQPAVMRARPFWEWSSIVDKTTRPSHADMHGVAMAASDPAWQLIAPPAGFNCRCTIAPIREEQAQEVVTGDDPRVRALPDDGWTSSGAPLGLFELDDESPIEAQRRSA